MADPIGFRPPLADLDYVLSDEPSEGYVARILAAFQKSGRSPLFSKAGCRASVNATSTTRDNPMEKVMHIPFGVEASQPVFTNAGAAP